MPLIDYLVNCSCSENRGEFLEKLQRARSQIKTGTSSQPVLTKTSTVKIVVGNWTLSCKKDGELHIQNTDGQQVGELLSLLGPPRMKMPPNMSLGTEFLLGCPRNSPMSMLIWKL